MFFSFFCCGLAIIIMACWMQAQNNGRFIIWHLQAWQKQRKRQDSAAAAAATTADVVVVLMDFLCHAKRNGEKKEMSYEARESRARQRSYSRGIPTFEMQMLLLLLMLAMRWSRRKTSSFVLLEQTNFSPPCVNRKSSIHARSLAYVVARSFGPVDSISSEKFFKEHF